MTCETKPEIKYRKNYTVPTHLVDTIDLNFELGEEKTVVTARSHIRKNPKGKDGGRLVLDGEEQVLKYVKVNGQELAADQYELTKESLILKNVPDEFDLEIQTVIEPQKNTSLDGLYKSKDMFCTQCEPMGFRKITYFIDRPDVMAKYTTTIIADKKLYPILLSNGNLVDSGDLDDGKHWVKWEDPFKKPSYLFAMVAGDLDYIEDYFTTMSGRKITLRIFCEKGYTDESTFAMSSLKKAMKWDEEKYGREYDLDLYMIVAVSDFNSGAMENKGLNIFNSQYIFAGSKTATDWDYKGIDSVIAHEYFHNWTGNRITCRDWFQLSLKEGLTVFRDQQFSEDVFSRGVVRIDDVQGLRNFQFSEDQGPLAHNVRPDSYIEMRNFYTSTVYNKGAEVIRMMKTILGDDGFRKGMDIYFDRHDGQAVTCDDFVSAMEEGGGVDLARFKLWYSQAGTPELNITSEYDADKKQYTLNVKQSCPKTPGQDKKLPMHVPLRVGLLRANGEELPLKLFGVDSIKDDPTSLVLNVTEPEQSFVFEDVSERPVPSLLRGFSAPIKLHYDYTDEELAFLMANDKDYFARFEAKQNYAMRIIFDLIKKWRAKEELKLPAEFVSSFREVLLADQPDKAFVAQMMHMPPEIYVADQMDVIDVEAIHEVREFMRKTLAESLKKELEQVYKANIIDGVYRFQVMDVAKRDLKNTCLSYLTDLGDEKYCRLAYDQFKTANNMTDEYAALASLSNSTCAQRERALGSFYEEWKHEPLVIDKWFRVQARSQLPGAVDRVKELSRHPDFDIKNPNRVRSLLGVFSYVNPTGFHDRSGVGYKLIADQVLILNKSNSQIAASLVKSFAKWRRFDEARQKLMKEQLERILKEPGLSKNVYEIVSKSLQM